MLEEQNSPGPAQRIFTGAAGTRGAGVRRRRDLPAAWRRCLDARSACREPDPVDEIPAFQRAAASRTAKSRFPLQSGASGRGRESICGSQRRARSGGAVQEPAGRDSGAAADGVGTGSDRQRRSGYGGARSRHFAVEASGRISGHGGETAAPSVAETRRWNPRRIAPSARSRRGAGGDREAHVRKPGQPAPPQPVRPIRRRPRAMEMAFRSTNAPMPTCGRRRWRPGT